MSPPPTLIDCVPLLITALSETVLRLGPLFGLFYIIGWYLAALLVKIRDGGSFGSNLRALASTYFYSNMASVCVCELVWYCCVSHRRVWDLSGMQQKMFSNIISDIDLRRTGRMGVTGLGPILEQQNRIVYGSNGQGVKDMFVKGTNTTKSFLSLLMIDAVAAALDRMYVGGLCLILFMCLRAFGRAVLDDWMYWFFCHAGNAWAA